MKAHIRGKKNNLTVLERCCRCDSVLVDGVWQDFTRIYLPIIDLSFKATICKHCRSVKIKSAPTNR